MLHESQTQNRSNTNSPRRPAAPAASLCSKLRYNTSSTRRHYIQQCRLFRVAEAVAIRNGVDTLLMYEALSMDLDGNSYIYIKRAVVETYTEYHTVDRRGNIVLKNR